MFLLGYENILSEFPLKVFLVYVNIRENINRTIHFANIMGNVSFERSLSV